MGYYGAKEIEAMQSYAPLIPLFRRTAQICFCPCLRVHICGDSLSIFCSWADGISLRGAVAIAHAFRAAVFLVARIVDCAASKLGKSPHFIKNLRNPDVSFHTRSAPLR